MSDDEERTFRKRKNILHYGSLAEVDKKRKAEGVTVVAAPSLAGTSRSGNINVSTEFMELESVTRKAPLTNRDLMLEEFERKRKSRQITVSVDDVEVRAHLRHLNEPMCLFGEGPADRRERLRNLLAKLGEDAIKRDKGEPKEEKDRDSSSTFYYQGNEYLQDARYFICDYSIPRAKERIANAKLERDLPEATRTNARQETYKTLRRLEISCSQVGDSRPISSVEFSPNAELLVTGSWSGLSKVWSMPNLELKTVLRAHNTNVSCVKFHPHSGKQGSQQLDLASSAVDGTVHLWTLSGKDNEEPIASLDGHTKRVAQLAFHPSGRFLATTCFDHSWRLWDIELRKDLNERVEVLHQEGHSKEVFAIDFQNDGALALTGGLDAYGRVWDLRTGRCIMFVEGHQKGIISVDFSPDGYHFVTGSMDNTVKVWDVRNRSIVYTLPAHTNIVSRVMFEKENGNYIVSASYDNTVCLWAYPNWTPITTLKGHDNKVMCCDVTPDNQHFVTSSYDRTFKLWTPDGF